MARRHAWLVLGVALFAAVFFFSVLDRYVEWDEAVYYSQSGGYRGISVQPIYFAPTREGGTPLLIAILRSLDLRLVGVRSGIALLTSGGAVAVFVALGRVVDRRRAGLVALFCFMSTWLTAAFAGSFYGSQIAGLAMLGAIVATVHLLDPGIERVLFVGACLGACVAVAFWFRQIESGIFLVVIFVFSIAAGRAWLWRNRITSLLMALAVFLVGFVLPWSVWTIRQWGSVSARVRAGRELQFRDPPYWTTDGVSDYFDVLAGTYRKHGEFAHVPTWPRLVVLGALLFVVVVTVRALLRSTSLPRAQAAALWLLMGVVSTTVLFQVFYYGSINVQERYMSGVVVLVSALVGVAASSAGPRRSFKGRKAAVLALTLLWVASQIAIVVPFQSARAFSGDVALQTALSMRSMASEGTCTAIARYGAPQLQLASGCRVRTATTEQAALEFARSAEEDDIPAFIAWNGILPLGAAWIEFGEEKRVLYAYVGADGSPARSADRD